MLSLLNDEHKYTRHSYRVVLTLFVNEMFCHSYSEYLYIFDMINSYSYSRANGCISSNPQDDTLLAIGTNICYQMRVFFKVIFPFCMGILGRCCIIIQTKLHISAIVFCVPHVWEHYY